MKYKVSPRSKISLFRSDTKNDSELLEEMRVRAYY